MEEGCMSGRTAGSIKVDTIMIRNMDMEDIPGLMGGCLKESGCMEVEKGRGSMLVRLGK